MSSDPVCSRCGKCCLHMRQYIAIERSIGDTDHYCRCSLSGDRFFARIGGENLSRFKETAGMEAYPDACPFLRQNKDGSFICTVYHSRPAHCRTFQCQKEK